MLELQMVYWWAVARIRAIRDNGEDAGMIAVEWIALAAIAIAAAITIGLIVYNKAKSKANTVNVQ